MDNLNVGGSSQPTNKANHPPGASPGGATSSGAKTGPLTSAQPTGRLANDSLEIVNTPPSPVEQQQDILQRVQEAQNQSQPLSLPELAPEPAASDAQAEPSNAQESDRMRVIHTGEGNSRTSAVKFQPQKGVEARVSFNRGVDAEGVRTSAVEAAAGTKVGQGELEAKAAHTRGADGSESKAKLSYDEEDTSLTASVSQKTDKAGDQSTTVSSGLSTTLDETVGPDGKTVKTTLGLDGEYKQDSTGQGAKGKAVIEKGDTSTQVSFDHQAKNDGRQSTTVGSSLSTTFGETVGSDGKTIKGNLGLDSEYKTNSQGQDLKGKVSYSLGDTSTTVSASDRRNNDDTFAKTVGFTTSTSFGQTTGADGKPLKGKIGLDAEHKTGSTGKDLKGKISYDIGDTSTAVSFDNQQNNDDTFAKIVGFSTSTSFGQTTGADGKPLKGKIGLDAEHKTESTGKELKGKVSYDIGDTSTSVSAKHRNNNDDTSEKAIGFAVSTPFGETLGPDGKPLKGKIGLEGEHRTDANGQELKGKLTYSRPSWDVSISGAQVTSNTVPTGSSLKLGASMGLALDGAKLSVDYSKVTTEQQVGIKYATANHAVGLAVKHGLSPDKPSAISTSWESSKYDQNGWLVGGKLEVGGVRPSEGQAWMGTASGALIAVNPKGEAFSARYVDEKKGVFFSYSTGF